MKFTKIISGLFVFVVLFSAISASTLKAETLVKKAQADSINIQAEISLWYEYEKNRDYKSAIKHAWTILENQPTFKRFKFYPKFEEMIIFLRDSVDAPEERRSALADTLLYIYDKAITNDEDRKSYFLAKKAYELETWHEAAPDSVIPVYEEAIELDPEISTFYKDRLGQLYIEAGDKLKAMDIYSALADAEPENARWNQRMESLADNPEQLMEILYTAWQQNPDNTEKAWKFASMALRVQNYERAIEALEYLTDQSPEVINYWKQLSKAYEKTSQYDKAIKAYKTLIELQPENRDNYVNLAIIYKDMDQLSVARSFLNKAKQADSGWDYPYWIEGQLYEQSARNCTGSKFDFNDKLVYQLAVNTYRVAASKSGSYTGMAADRANSLSNSTPSQEDYFFRNLKPGAELKIEGDCYSWIDRTVTVPSK